MEGSWSALSVVDVVATEKIDHIRFAPARLTKNCSENDTTHGNDSRSIVVFSRFDRERRLGERTVFSVISHGSVNSSFQRLSEES